MATHTLTRLQSPRRRQRQYQWVKSFVGDMLAFLVALGVCYVVKLVGALPISEVILIPFIPLLWVLNRHRLNLRKRKLGVILTLALLWLFGQIATDIYRSTVFHDWSRGQALILFFLLDIIGLTLLLKGNVRRQLIFFLGLGIGFGLVPRLQPGWESADAATTFKFGYSWAVMYTSTLISCYFYKRRQYFGVALLLFVCLSATILFNFRSGLLILFVTACLILPVIPERIGRFRILPPARTRARVFTIIGIALVAGALAGKGMAALAASGALGPGAQAKNSYETKAGWGLLLGGRPEILVSSRAVMDSPILGHGSWAKDPKYSEMLSEIEAEYGMGTGSTANVEKSGGVIPSHSHLMNAWVLSGVLGAVFWIYLFALTLKAIVKLAMLQPATAPVFVLLLSGMTWDLLFSPFGGVARVTGAFIVVVICDILDPDSEISNTVVPRFKRTRVSMHPRNLGRVSRRFSGNF